MNEKENVDNNKKGRNTTKGFESESGSKGKDEKTEEKSKSKAEKAFCKPHKINMSNIDVGAIYARVESLFRSASRLDAQVTEYAGDLYLRVKNYLKISIESYKE